MTIKSTKHFLNFFRLKNTFTKKNPTTELFII